jgi:hypothetical protein
MEQSKRRFRQIAEAKLAVAALFHSLESQAAASKLNSYHSFLHRIFPSQSGGDYQDLLARTPARVLSFNYDRLFEIAFLQHFKVDPNCAFYSTRGLNSGLDNVYNSKVEFAEERFSFLKLHGSVGMIASDVYGEVRHWHSVPCADGISDIKYTDFFLPNADGSISDEPRTPLIFFPHEKENLLSGQQIGSPYRVYADKIWKRAHDIAEQATEITLIGYSVCETDFSYVLPLLSSAMNCKQIVIQNPNAEEIRDRLATRAPDLRQQLRAYQAPF